MKQLTDKQRDTLLYEPTCAGIDALRVINDLTEALATAERTHDPETGLETRLGKAERRWAEWQARADSAEARVRELEGEARDDTTHRHNTLSYIKSIEARVRELEACRKTGKSVLPEMVALRARLAAAAALLRDIEADPKQQRSSWYRRLTAFLANQPAAPELATGPLFGGLVNLDQQPAASCPCGDQGRPGHPVGWCGQQRQPAAPTTLDHDLAAAHPHLFPAAPAVYHSRPHSDVFVPDQPAAPVTGCADCGANTFEPHRAGCAAPPRTEPRWPCGCLWLGPGSHTCPSRTEAEKAVLDAMGINVKIALPAPTSQEHPGTEIYEIRDVEE